MALGYLVNRRDSQEALTYLLESASPDSWSRLTVHAQAIAEKQSPTELRDLSRYAIIALGVSGNLKAAEHLKSLRTPEKINPAEYLRHESNSENRRSFQEELGDVVEQSLKRTKKFCGRVC